MWMPTYRSIRIILSFFSENFAMIRRWVSVERCLGRMEAIVQKLTVLRAMRMCLVSASYFDANVSLKLVDMFLTEQEESIGLQLSQHACRDGKRSPFERSGSFITDISEQLNKDLLAQAFLMERRIISWVGIRSGSSLEWHTE